MPALTAVSSTELGWTVLNAPSELHWVLPGLPGPAAPGTAQWTVVSHVLDPGPHDSWVGKWGALINLQSLHLYHACPLVFINTLQQAWPFW